MNINSVFPSKYLKASDLQGRTVRVTISNVVVEKIGDDQRPVLYFQGKEKGVVLNKTNANTIANTYGPETDGWLGAPIELFSAMVDFAGKMTEAIRVRVPRPAPAQAQTAVHGWQQPQQQPVPMNGPPHGQHIPPGAAYQPQQPAPAMQAGGNSAQANSSLAAALDDEIPF